MFVYDARYLRTHMCGFIFKSGWLFSSSLPIDSNSALLITRAYFSAGKHHRVWKDAAVYHRRAQVRWCRHGYVMLAS